MKLIKQIYRKLIKFEFTRFFLVGGISTIVDWSAFYILAIIISVYYQGALITGFILGAITHYTLNKIFTFKCKSKKIAKQFALFFIIAIITLFLSIFIMYFLIESFYLNKMIARMTTTAMMLCVNYVLHKNLTFNKRFFN